MARTLGLLQADGLSCFELFATRPQVLDREQRFGLEPLGLKGGGAQHGNLSNVGLHDRGLLRRRPNLLLLDDLNEALQAPCPGAPQAASYPSPPGDLNEALQGILGCADCLFLGRREGNLELNPSVALRADVDLLLKPRHLRRLARQLAHIFLRLVRVLESLLLEVGHRLGEL
eukprot:CAMPEP_0181286220 /NCGR_PEP_ID=MMETSP1097-20121128/16464_1 /TAXON_ID=35684 /ORGANISM="Pseudopedinella elastica, Strain CCMP716" /LENGTH=172 /DNA_ID=CAMNT_0023389993 /DNA_START=131 /DNA_END=646 /DNA_ORIENTATION=-